MGLTSLGNRAREGSGDGAVSPENEGRKPAVTLMPR